jgi:putative transposase
LVLDDGKTIGAVARDLDLTPSALRLWVSYAHAKEALFDYIEVFYNQRCRHSTLGQISPAEFERRFNAA